MSGLESQVSSAILMVRPKSFGYNAETAATNRFQNSGFQSSGLQHPGESRTVATQALAEFDAFAAALRGEGVTVCAVEDTVEPVKPDAVFPNNWVSFHADGTVVLYPMQAQNRRIERRADIVQTVAHETGFQVRRTLDLTMHEQAGRFLEGTGSLVLDQRGRVAYACRSPRTDEHVAREWARELGFELELFGALDQSGTPIYHTNVLMSVGTRFAVVALDAIDVADRARIGARLAATDREVIAIDHAEMGGFCGNILEIGTWDEYLGDFRLLVMSRSAQRAMKRGKYAQLSSLVDAVLGVPLEVIERHGGGSVRCMLAEVFLR